MSIRSRIAGMAKSTGYYVERTPPSSSVAGHLKKLLFPQYRIDCVLDVGANIGQYAQALRAAGYQGRIVSYEPVRPVFHQLASAARSDPRWIAIHTALGDETGVAAMRLASSSEVSSLHELNGLHISERFTRIVGTEEVPIERLADRFDEDVAGCSRIYLKLDTQGHDLAVLAGARPVIDRVIGMQIEVSIQPIYRDQPHWLEAIQTVERLGFVATGLFPVARKPDTTLVEMDAVFVRPGSGLRQPD